MLCMFMEYFSPHSQSQERILEKLQGFLGRNGGDIEDDIKSGRYQQIRVELSGHIPHDFVNERLENNLEEKS
jgi:hypothetical protein